MVFGSQPFYNILEYFKVFNPFEEINICGTAVIPPIKEVKKFYFKFVPEALLTIQHTGYIKKKGQDDLDHPARAVVVVHIVSMKNFT